MKKRMLTKSVLETIGIKDQDGKFIIHIKDRPYFIDQKFIYPYKGLQKKKIDTLEDLFDYIYDQGRMDGRNGLRNEARMAMKQIFDIE